jgi:hypothetical protein
MESGVALPTRSKRSLSLLRVFWVSILSGSVAYGQGGGIPIGPNDQDKLTTAVGEVKAGNWASVDEVVSGAGPARAVPILHELFATSRDTETKERIAGALVKLGDKDGVYIDFMLAQATEAVDDDIPNPFPLNPDRNQPQIDRQDPDALQKQVTPEFLAWAKSRGIPLNEAGQEALYTIPGRLLQLGMTGDKRAIPVLRRGLLSHNIMIETMSASGLAQLKDKDSIPLIIDACERTPTAASAIAMFSLRSFDDPRAQSVAQSYIAKLEEEARKRGADKKPDADQLK